MLDPDAAKLDVPTGSIAGSSGISTFIKEELVADGVGKPQVPFPVGKAHKRKNQSAYGKARGRALDRDFSTSILMPGQSTAATDRVHRALGQLGVVAVRTQYRVLTRDTMLTTLIDAVGVSRRDPSTLWCIELKTTAVSSANYAAYADSACQRTPNLRCIPSLPNTERCRHALQAGYGALCLSRLVGKAVKAVVVVMCGDGVCVTRVVPPTFQCDMLFRRLPRIPVNRRREIAPPRPKARAPLASWPAAIAVHTLRRLGLHAIRPQLARGIVWVADAAERKVGVCTYVLAWHAMGRNARATVHAQLATAARRHKGAGGGGGSRVSTYVLGPQTPAGANQLTVAGPAVQL